MDMNLQNMNAPPPNTPILRQMLGNGNNGQPVTATSIELMQQLMIMNMNAARVALLRNAQAPQAPHAPQAPAGGAPLQGLTAINPYFFNPMWMMPYMQMGAYGPMRMANGNIQVNQNLAHPMLPPTPLMSMEIPTPPPFRPHPYAGAPYIGEANRAPLGNQVNRGGLVRRPRPRNAPALPRIVENSEIRTFPIDNAWYAPMPMQGRVIEESEEDFRVAK